MMYKLTLNLDERRALEFVAYRYCCGQRLINTLEHCEMSVAKVTRPCGNRWDQDCDIEFDIPEHLAWDIAEMVREDTDDLRTSHPILSGELMGKLINFTLEIV